MHPASAFIKPKYFKTRVKGRKARAGPLRASRETVACARAHTSYTKSRGGFTVKIENLSLIQKDVGDYNSPVLLRSGVDSAIERERKRKKRRLIREVRYGVMKSPPAPIL